MGRPPPPGALAFDKNEHLFRIAPKGVPKTSRREQFKSNYEISPSAINALLNPKTAFRPESSRVILSLQLQTREAITPNRLSSRVLLRHLISYGRLTFLTYLFRALESLFGVHEL
jgi:hypothetical protein